MLGIVGTGDFMLTIAVSGFDRVKGRSCIGNIFLELAVEMVAATVSRRVNDRGYYVQRSVNVGNGEH